MDPETAQAFFQKGATFVCHDVPEGTEFGIDYMSWTVGPEFRGVKMIPPGIHFIYYSARNSSGDSAPRTGSFYNFKQKELIVRRWNQLEESISEDGVSVDDIERIQANLKDIDRFLGPYPYDKYKKWVSLSSFMSTELVEKLQPTNRRISAATDFISEVSNSQSRKSLSQNSSPIKNTGQDNQNLPHTEIQCSAKSETNVDRKSSDNEPTSLKEAEAKLPNMKIREESKIRFSQIPKQKYPPGSTPSEISHYSMDSSYALESLLSLNYSKDEVEILGEIQFSFICFLMGQVLYGFEQWKHLVHLLCSSEEALIKHPELYTNFITVLYFHIQETPQDFFVDILSENNFLTQTLHELFSNLDNSEVESSLRKKGLKFRDHLTQKFKWDFTSEPDEYAPTVVHLD